MKPLWFGPDARPLFGWLHVPEGGYARAGVVLSPPLGIEAASGHYAYRRLADRLADEGFVALRFDYDGTGDSAGQQNEPGRAAAWLGSIQSAVDLVRDLGLDRICVVGMRMGATLVAEAFGSGPVAVDDIVLWDPCASGRTFLREQSALWSFALGARSNEDGSIETPGLMYDKDTITDLSAFEIASGDGPLAERVLLLMRSDRKGDRRMNARLSMSHVERVAIVGQEDLVDVVPGHATVPEGTVETIVEWLASGRPDGTRTLIDLGGFGRTRALVGTTLEGVLVDEWPVSLGPMGTFGIVTCPRGPAGGTVGPESDLVPEPARGASNELPTIVFLNSGVVDHVGPARLWVQFARSWAAAGFRAVRFDLIGIGDSPLRDGQADQDVYPVDALDDVLAVLRAVSPDDPSNAVLVGLCSGGYHALEGAIAIKVRGVCAVNPDLTFRPPELSTDDPNEPEAGKLDRRRQATGAKKNWTRALPGRGVLGPLLESLPDAAWGMINRFAMVSPPVRTLAKVVAEGVNVYVIAGPDEARSLTRGETRTMRRLQRTEGFCMEVIPGLQHSLFERCSRELASKLLTDHVVGQFRR